MDSKVFLFIVTFLICSCSTNKIKFKRSCESNDLNLIIAGVFEGTMSSELGDSKYIEYKSIVCSKKTKKCSSSSISHLSEVVKSSDGVRLIDDKSVKIGPGKITIEKGTARYILKSPVFNVDAKFHCDGRDYNLSY